MHFMTNFSQFVTDPPVEEDMTAGETGQGKLGAFHQVTVEFLLCGLRGHLKCQRRQKRQLSPKCAAAHKTESEQGPLKQTGSDRRQQKLRWENRKRGVKVFVYRKVNQKR